MGTGLGFDLIRHYRQPGPVAAAYILSMGAIDLIRGPWGSGKTVASIFKQVRHAAVDFPVCKDGVVHVRSAAIRDTYRDLARTALASWQEAFPKNGPYTASDRDAWSGGQDRPVTHKLEWDVIRKWYVGKGAWEPKLTKVRLEMQFGAIGEQNLEAFFKGYEISMGWDNECDLNRREVPQLLYGRTGRYPPEAEMMEWEKERLGARVDPDSGRESINVPRIICGDFNPADEANWTYELEMEEPEKAKAMGFNFFAQPSGLSPQAENREGKARHKYEEEERTFGGPKAPDAIRNVHGKYAPKAKGTVVYSLFDTFKHRADQKLEPVKSLPFYMGFDAGGRPACAIGQFMPTGQFRALREVISDPAVITGPRRHSEAVMEVLLRDFAGMRCGGAWGDPSAWDGADKLRGELAHMETVQLALQIPIYPTESNDFKSRFEAVEFYLNGDLDANTPRSLWCPTLKYTIRGFVSQYHLTKNSSAGKTESDEVEKNEYSHIQDAWQYLLYGYRGRATVKKDAAQMGRPANVVPMRSVRMKSDFDVFKS